MRAGLAVLAATLVAFAPPAQAHDSLISSTPSDGEHLEISPDQVVLTFSADPIEVGGDILVVDATGTDRAASEPVYDGRDVTVDLEPDLPGGVYEIRWRIVSSDGHPIQGVIEFEVGSGTDTGSDTLSDDDAPSDSDVPSDSGTAPDDDQAAPSAAPGGATDPADSQADSQADRQTNDQADSSIPWRPIAVAAGGALLAGLIYAAVLLIRRARRTGAPAEPSSDGSDS